MTLIQATRFYIPTMTCPSCERRISAALKALEGVVEVDVRLQDQEVVIRHDILTASKDDLAEALEAAHYKAYFVPEGKTKAEVFEAVT